MFEARLVQGILFKKVVDSIKDLVNDVNFEVSPTGLGCQAMDASHVCLISVQLHADAFDVFRCDRPRSIGMSLKSLSTVLKCMDNHDVLFLKADDEGNKLNLMFDSPGKERISDFEMSMMEIEQEQLGIPENEFSSQVRMPSSEFQRIVKDLRGIGDQVNISVTKEGIKFTTSGEIGTANVTCRHNPHADKPERQTMVEMNEPVSLSFGMRFLVDFAKAGQLSETVTLTLTKDLPLQVEFKLADTGYIRFYLAPKVEDEDDGMNGGVPMGDE